MKKVLFIDRDGVLLVEPPKDFQVDSFEKLKFYPGVFSGLGKIAKELDYELVLVTNQDGLGTSSFPEENFIGPHQLLINTLEGEGIKFSRQCIDRTFPEDNAPTRKPRTGLLKDYMKGEHDLKNSFVIGDRLTDMELARNLGAKGIYMPNDDDPGQDEISLEKKDIFEIVALKTRDWEEIYTFLRLGARTARTQRTTKETDISIFIDLDGSGRSQINTGLKFFDHMLEQIAKHGALDLEITVNGDLEVDEHHTIEDTAIALGNCMREALGNKIGIERYGFFLPMDDCQAKVALDFGGRNWLTWKAKFNREHIGDMPTEMFMHFFKSFSDASLSNLYIKAKGDNEHHKIESIFKAFAKALKMAKKRNAHEAFLPSTKGTL
ncbi:MAG: bifunctional histidinol-phosphatase/imidazoleglycerol-phosphate dehydratase HisB [Brumimicrobium sp.]|nr:bifunctional histidinol-phosphatase/imidazoleglycerol-phosphate dehydratase HisB [Brumimicrobium sp.]